MPAITRRAFLGATTAAAVGLAGCRGGRSSATTRAATASAGEWVNDVHSQLNPTHVAGIARPQDADELCRLVRGLRRGESLSVCGGRHAGGGQQFCTDRTLVDTAGLSRVLAFDDKAGTIDVEAGIRWPELIDALHARPGNTQDWSIHQKQGGADGLSLGGAVGSNIHSRHLNSRPFVGDVEAITLVTPDGELTRCDRQQEPDLFRHVIGGYGLFGVVYALTLRLEKRRKLVRRVIWADRDTAVATLEAKRDAGAWHGDFQFSIDPASDDFCRRGLLSWYEPAPADATVRGRPTGQAAAAFEQLAQLAHGDKARAMAVYRDAVLSRDGLDVDFSDDWQRADYVPDYHRAVNAARGGPGSEILSELHVPRAALWPFLIEAAAVLRHHGAELIYGVVRLIEPDGETALAWATRPMACVIFNLHTQFAPAAVAKNVAVFRDLLTAAIACRGSYYLTYHRAATPDQIELCYPQLRDVLAEKRRRDPDELLASDWYRYYRDTLRI